MGWLDRRLIRRVNARFLDAQFTTEPDMRYDVWEQKFRFDERGEYCPGQKRGVWYLVSCGPDQKCNSSWEPSDDDLCQKIN